ncbi:hypothetical protein EVAR_53625_1 [Eumeta japonica]|uniref:Uncharacterized protein n=1 Tax=Eumeta variegata TaxID=151549 RepID=A0A4C1WYW5_EUMVA|nr:hypothetical protein EVAR_53625_1 [Eumeta japonica]
MDTRDFRGVTSVLPASWIGIGRLVRKEWTDGRRPGDDGRGIGNPNSHSLDEMQQWKLLLQYGRGERAGQIAELERGIRLLRFGRNWNGIGSMMFSGANDNSGGAGSVLALGRVSVRRDNWRRGAEGICTRGVIWTYLPTDQRYTTHARTNEIKRKRGPVRD